MTSVDLILDSRFTNQQLVTRQPSTSFIYFEQFYGWVGQCLALTDTLRLAFRNLCAKLVVQQFRVLQLWQFCGTIHPSSTKNERESTAFMILQI